MLRTRSTRRGFTLVELFAVLAIIGLLMALFAPAIQSAREAARRMECENRLRQWGLALANYESAHRVFPPGAVLGGWSWRTLVLPQIEQQALYNRINFGNNRQWPDGYFSCGPEYQLQLRTRLDWQDIGPIVRCPSEPFDFRSCSNYVGVAGNITPYDWFDVRDYYPGDELESPGNGMLYLCSRVSPALVTDGASATLFVGEQGFGNDGGPTSFCGSESGFHMAWMPTSGGLRPGNAADPEHGSHFWSYHPGGVQFLFVDGHVQLLNYSLDARVYFALSSRDGGETVGEF